MLPTSRFSIAPMLDWTDRHCRYFHRLLTSRTQLYTEMVTTGAILHGKGDYLLFNEQEQPVVLQLGGSEPGDLAKCAKIAQQRGYQELNLNIGCPSDRVQNGRFGACLMAEPQLVADCVKAMQDSASIPVTVKTRIGIDHQDSYSFLTNFIETVATETQCQDFIIHARKAWLQGLSPKENREIPELDYERVYQLKRDYSSLNISINGGISTLTQTLEHLEHVDGVMMGRAAYQNPYLLADVDRQIFADHDQAPISREQVVEQMIPYIQEHLAQGGRLQHITRHMLGLYQGVPGARRWRRHLSENAHRPEAGIDVLLDAMKQLRVD